MLQPALWVLLTRTLLYCSDNNIPFRITSLISDRENVKSKSNSHEEGRAFDLSVYGWTEPHIYRFQHLINTEYSDIAAISSRDNIPRAVVYHDSGHGKHLHIQVRPNANYRKFIKD